MAFITLIVSFLSKSDRSTQLISDLSLQISEEKAWRLRMTFGRALVTVEIPWTAYAFYSIDEAQGIVGF